MPCAGVDGPGLQAGFGAVAYRLCRELSHSGGAEPPSESFGVLFRGGAEDVLETSGVEQDPTRLS